MSDADSRLNDAADRAEAGADIIEQVANGGDAVEVPTASGPRPSLAKWFADRYAEFYAWAALILADCLEALGLAQTVLTDTVAAKVAAESAQAGAVAARDAALLSRGLWQTTAQGIGQGVAGIASLVAGSGGANGTFALAFSGGTQVIAPKGYFVVAGGVVTQVVITYAGHYSAGTPTLSFAASAGLTGASATAVMGANTPVDAYFSVPVAGSNDSLILYKVTTGPVATEITRYLSSAIMGTVNRAKAAGGSYPIAASATAAHVGGSQTKLDQILRAVVDIRLFNVSTTDSYYIERIRRNTSSQWAIVIKRTSDDALVGQTYVAVTEPTNPEETQTFLINQASPVLGFGLMSIKWSEMPVGEFASGWTLPIAPECVNPKKTSPINSIPFDAASYRNLMFPTNPLANATVNTTTRVFTWPDIVISAGTHNTSGRILLAGGSITFTAGYQIAWLDLNEARASGLNTVPNTVVRVSVYKYHTENVAEYSGAPHQLPLAWSTAAGHMAVNPLLRSKDSSNEVVVTNRALRGGWQFTGLVKSIRDSGANVIASFGDIRVTFGVYGISSKLIEGVTDLVVPSGQAAYVDLDGALNGAGKLTVQVTTAGYTAVSAGTPTGAFIDDRRVYLLVKDTLGLSGELLTMQQRIDNINIGQVWLKIAPCNVTWDAVTRTLAWDNSLILPTVGERVKLLAGSVTFTSAAYQVAYLNMDEASYSADVSASAIHVGAYHDAADADRYRGYSHMVPIFYWNNASDYGPIGGFPKAVETGAPAALSSLDPDDIVVKVGADTVSIFVKGANPSSNKYLEQLLVHLVVAEAGVGSSQGNADLWRLSACYESTYDPETEVFTRGNTILNGGELECAIKESGAADYIGGVHGDEKLTAMHFWADGKPVSLASAATIICREVQFNQVATLYRCNTTTAEVVATHVKDVSIYREGGSLIIRPRQYVDWTQSLVIQAAMMPMLPIKRLVNDTSGAQVTDTAMRLPLNTPEDVSVDGFTPIVTVGSLPKAKIWGATSGISAEVEVFAAPDNPTRSFYIANPTSYNKFYYSVAGNITGAVTHTTTIGEKWFVDSQIKIRTAN